MKILKLFVLLGLALGLVSCQTTEPSSAKFLSSYQGLKSSGFGGTMVHRGSGVDLSSYDRVRIEPVRVIGSAPVGANGEAKKSHATSAEARQLAKQFESELRRELGETHRIVSSGGRGTATVRAALVELRGANTPVFLAGYAPYAGAASTAMRVVTGTTPGSGAATVQAEVLDSRTRKQLFVLVDRDQSAKWEITEGLSRWGQAESAFKEWSARISKELTPVAGRQERAKTVAEKKSAEPKARKEKAPKEKIAKAKGGSESGRI
jgi:hypothetical protein